MTRTRVKVCGLTDHVGFDAAVEHGADAVGFVFAPSVRRVTPAQAAALVAALPALVTPVGVFLLPGPDDAAQTCRSAGIGLAQYDHAAGPLPTGSGLAWLPVFRLGPHATTDAFTQTRPDAVVLVEGQTSGSGATIDWAAVAALARQRRVILAGGLTPANVALAIRTVRPFGVDVSSGVESGPGKKDPIKIRDFLQAVRAADMEPS